MIRGLGLFLIGFVAVCVIATACYADTQLGAGYATIFTLQGNTATASAWNLGVTYRPDPVPAPNAPVKLSLQPTNFGVAISQNIVEDGANLTMTGLMYRLWAVPGFEVMGEGALVAKNLTESTFGLGGYGGVRCYFNVASKPFCLRLGGGYIAPDPILAIGLNFLSE